MPATHTELIRYIEGLTLAQGRFKGQPFKLHPWERRFLRGGFAPDVVTAALSLARANGKSVLVAGIGAACVDIGAPLVEQNAECVIVASTFAQGKIIFKHLHDFVQPTLDKHGRRFRVSNSLNTASIEDRDTGASVRVMGNKPKSLHGLQPRLIISGEIAQWELGLIDASLSALETSMGKIPDARMLTLGTRASSPEHPFERMLNGGADYSQIHAAQPDDDIFKVRTWHKANPSMRYMPDLRLAIERDASKARDDASMIPRFESLRLNKGVSDVVEALLISAGAWRSIEAAQPPDVKSNYILGIDLGQNAAMSAAAAYNPLTKGLDCFAVFPANPSLAERGLRDGVGGLYTDMANRGELLVAGDRVSDVGRLLAECVRRWGRPAAVVCDRWREAELRQELTAAQFPSGAAVITRGQGFKDGGEDVRDFRRAVLDGMVVSPVSLLLRSAIAEARVTSDAAGNSKLAKKSDGGRRHGRDDAVAASILAIAHGYRAFKSGALRKRKKRRIRIIG